MEDLRVLLFLHFFEPGIILYLGMTLLKQSTSSTRLFLRLAIFSIFVGLFVYILRTLAVLGVIPLGLHSIILLVIGPIIAKHIVKLRNSQAISCWLMGFCILTVLDLLNFPVLSKYYKLETAISNPFTHIFLGWISNIEMLLIVLLLKTSSSRFGGKN